MFNKSRILNKEELELWKEVTKKDIKLRGYQKKYDNNKLSLEYDKKEISLSEIIEILSDNNIMFSELKTYDEDLETIFLKFTSELYKKI